MFKGVIAQDAVQAILSDIISRTFPQAALFSGPSFSGKLTAALETARILLCTQRGDDECACLSCAAHRELNSPDTLIMGSRSLSAEIRATASSFLSFSEPELRSSFIRAVRKLTIRFSPVFAESGDARRSKVVPLLENISESIEELSNPNLERTILEKTVAKIEDAACKLDEGFLYSSLPVSAVRGASSWLHVKPSGKAKVLIIEGADTMQEGARNALLKILEEPPESVHFILTAGKKSAVMPTILSRVRNYPFIERSVEAQCEVLSRVFRARPEAGKTISSFINEFLLVKPLQIEECARRFLFALFDSSCDNLLEMPALRSSLAGRAAAIPAISAKELSAALNSFKPAAVWNLFLEALLKLIRRAVRNPYLAPRETEVLCRWASSVRQAREGVFVFNLSPQAALERLEHELRTFAA